MGFRSRFQVAAGVIALAFASRGGSVALAQTAALPAPAATASVTVPVQYQAYQRANENLADQTIYLQNQISTLEQDAQSLNPPDPNPPPGYTPPVKVTAELIKQDTQGFCDGAGSDGTNQQCINDYTETERRQLEQIKNPLISNETAIHNLQTQTDPSQGPVDPAKGATVGIPSGLTVQTPDAFKASVLTFGGSDTISADYAQAPKVTEASVQNWVKTVTAPPQESDFYMTKAVPIDPADPSKGTDQVLVINPKTGQPELDKQAYQEALTEFKDAQAAGNTNVQANAGLYQHELSDLSKSGAPPKEMSFAQRIANRAEFDIENEKTAPKERSPTSITQALDDPAPVTGHTPPPAAAPAAAIKNYMDAEDLVVLNFDNATTKGGAVATAKNGTDPLEQKADLDSRLGKEDKIVTAPAPTNSTSNANVKPTDALYMSPTNIDDAVNKDPDMNLKGPQQLGAPNSQ
jgi:hypothetical protein